MDLRDKAHARENRGAKPLTRYEIGRAMDTLAASAPRTFDVDLTPSAYRGYTTIVICRRGHKVRARVDSIFLFLPISDFEREVLSTLLPAFDICITQRSATTASSRVAGL